MVQECVMGLDENRVKLLPFDPLFGGDQLVNLRHTDLETYELQSQDGRGVLKLAE